MANPLGIPDLGSLASINPNGLMGYINNLMNLDQKTVMGFVAVVMAIIVLFECLAWWTEMRRQEKMR